MSKYRGKYQKCRTCEYSEEVMMFLVIVKNECPHGTNFNGDRKMSDKHKCEACNDYIARAGEAE